MREEELTPLIERLDRVVGLDLGCGQGADALAVAEGVEERRGPGERAVVVVALREGEEEVADVGGGDLLFPGQPGGAERHQAVECLDGGLLVGLALGQPYLPTVDLDVPGVAGRAVPRPSGILIGEPPSSEGNTG